jgi:hypothetical protein
MSKKPIPTGDSDFASKAESFARAIAEEPGKFQITQSDSDALSAAVAKFRQTLQAHRRGGQSDVTRIIKDEARKEAVAIMRRLRNLVRANDRIDAATKVLVNIHERSKAKQLLVPNEPPRLRFLRAHHESASTPMHELMFQSLDCKSKPPGAVRLELFVDLIPPNEEIPAMPGANHAGVMVGRAWYLRSYTRSPIKLIPPMARVPMRVVYWGRWADSQGNVGPFSATAVGWIEGGSQAFLPGGTGMVMSRMNGPNPVPILEDANATREGEQGGRDETYSVAVLEVRYGSVSAAEIAKVLPSPVREERRQLEPPRESEAA